jgi:hypothetical protein
MAAVVRYAPEHRLAVLTRRTLARTSQGEDAYQRGAVLAWLVRALAERDQKSEAVKVLDEALRRALQATPAASRSEALYLLYNAPFPLGARAVTPLLRHLLALQEAQPHWRCTRALVWALAMHSTIDPGTFDSILKHLPNPKIAARVHRCIALGLTRPREFFWR